MIVNWWNVILHIYDQIDYNSLFNKLSEMGFKNTFASKRECEFLFYTLENLCLHTWHSAAVSAFLHQYSGPQEHFSTPRSCDSGQAPIFCVV